jgi:AraC-like DNA-binding protein
MRQFVVHSLPVNEVMEDIAKEMNVPYTCNCDEYYIEVPEHLGKGIIYGIMFDSGMGMINYEVQFNEDVEFRFVKDHIHPIKCIFCYEGSLVHYFADNVDSKHNIQEYQNAIVASQGKSGHILSFPANNAIKVNSIEINRELFKGKFSCPIATMPLDMQRLFDDMQARAAFHYQGEYSLAIFDMIGTIKNYQNEGFLRRIFLEAKGYELLAYQFAQLLDDEKENSITTLLRKSELKKIEVAAAYLRSNLNKSITIKELSKQIGINENKLQAGFQYLYYKTINNYVQDLRLEEGSRLLLNPEYNITEIVRMIGIKSASYFSRVFKEKYGMTPKNFQLKYMKRP